MLDPEAPAPRVAPAPPEVAPSKLRAASMAMLLALGYASPLIGLVTGFGLGVQKALAALAGLVAFAFFVRHLYRDMRARGMARYRPWAELLILGVLQLWGLAYVFALAKEECTTYNCGPEIHRPFAVPEIYPLIALHTIVALAYLVSRRRPEALRPAGEALVVGLLLAGSVAHALVAIQFGPWVLLGLAFPPAFMPCLAPVLTIFLLLREARARLRRRGRELAIALLAEPAQSPYRRGEPEQRDAPLRIHRGLAARAAVLAPALLGLYGVAHAIWKGSPTAAFDVFTRTCEYTFSQVPVEVLSADCHYLCTVAARGHGWLVRPERIGRRGGRPILVNRQLAIANAFEDLLHERWPRFGRLARRIYDRLGLPVSRYIRTRWLADIVYVAMKPAEYGFALALLILDRRSPEERIGRMYR